MTQLLSSLIEASPENFEPLLPHITELTFNALPEKYQKNDSYNFFNVIVTYRGNNLWAVKTREGTLDKDGEPTFEPPANNKEQFLVTHRFPLLEAIKIAEKAQYKVTCFDRTPKEWVEWKEQQK